MPKTNRGFWKNKLESNVRRDKKVEKILKKQGWGIYKLWECELEQKKEKILKSLINYIKEKSRIL